MTPRTPPIATTAARTSTVHIKPGQIVWACLAPGSLLQATQGRVSVQPAPRVEGCMPHLPPPTLLKAGEHLPWMDRRHATWVQLGSATTGPAEIRITDSAPQPGLGQKAWQLLRRAFTDRKSLRSGGVHGALHTAASWLPGASR